MPRIVLLVTSPRLPAGLLTATAWDVVRAAPVLAGAESELVTALRVAGAEVRVPDGPAVPALLDAAAAHKTVVWLAGPAGDESLARELGLRLAREPGQAELELMYGSWDPPGARLLDAVAVLDRLLSPGGDPWKRAQTHRSLAGFLLEECYEAYDAIAAGDTDALREELGDVLLQVVLHARLAEELPEGERWTVDDVAGGLVDKMVRRNPHVFADAQAGSLEEITASWERIKQAEKSRDSVLDGIAVSQPALALAAKILERATRAGLGVPLPSPQAQPDAEAVLGTALLTAVSEARDAGLDPETALRRATLAHAEAIREAESTSRPS
ncbi:nucleoside triphosphate pyrophosphohydrolase [Micromonospora craniellae]|uniref:Nucleoside triphosphate pyrophosphohydrolase n=1 Tax=Micromonospora craniellae TaxID=2294034 RepID=A0A372FT94_9ACTN|nr:nucleoside triphosphate pyrophosphohydrolase [Micromonospora craniellae]QOC93642.1 nucleoside triphosphate pyrophosphohydrolase [Micromonospora craniellae]RFS43965.1 nucleoside triphosphate pyrophosphohydrolase [Micromonospora craniellae]